VVLSDLRESEADKLSEMLRGKLITRMVVQSTQSQIKASVWPSIGIREFLLAMRSSDESRMFNKPRWLEFT